MQTITVATSGKGLYEITDQVRAYVRQGGSLQGVCTVFIRHTSASLTIQENADLDVRRDLQAWIERLVPERDALYTHTVEGPDDMPAHIKAALTATTLSIPFVDRELLLGTWQGIYVWEHRTRAHQRQIVLHTTS